MCFKDRKSLNEQHKGNPIKKKNVKSIFQKIKKHFKC